MMFLAEARPRIAAELAEQDENPLKGLHRRLEVVPGAQALEAAWHHRPATRSARPCVIAGRPRPLPPGLAATRATDDSTSGG